MRRRQSSDRYRFSAFWLRSKCSICSYQLNIWYVAHWVTTILNWFLVLGGMPGACSALATGRPGIAVLPGMAHSISIMYDWSLSIKTAHCWSVRVIWYWFYTSHCLLKMLIVWADQHIFSLFDGSQTNGGRYKNRYFFLYLKFLSAPLLRCLLI